MRFRHVADLPGPYDLGGHAVGLVRKALVAHLRSDLVFGRGVEQQPCFPGRARQWLFDVDMLAALHAGERDGGVHEVRHADRTGVDVLALLVEHDAEVFVFGGLLVALQVCAGAGFVHVAQRYDVFRARGIVQVHAALPAAANGGDVQFLVERLIAESPQRRNAAEARAGHRAGQQRTEKEMPSRDTVS